MSKGAGKAGEEPRIIHIMADGHIEENLEGYRVVCTPETEAAFRVAAQVARRMAQKKPPAL